MDASFRRHIDDQPRPPIEMRKTNAINLLSVCRALDLCSYTFQPCLEEPVWSSEWRKRNVLYSAITNNVCNAEAEGEATDGCMSE